MAGERLELGDPLADRVGCGMREDSENVVLDAYGELAHSYIYIHYIQIYK